MPALTGLMPIEYNRYCGKLQLHPMLLRYAGQPMCRAMDAKQAKGTWHCSSWNFLSPLAGLAFIYFCPIAKAVSYFLSRLLVEEK